MNIDLILQKLSDKSITLSESIEELQNIDHSSIKCNIDELNDLIKIKFDTENSVFESCKELITNEEETIKKAGVSFAVVEEYGRNIFIKKMQEYGLFTKANEKYTIDQIIKKLEIIEQYRSFVMAFLYILEKEGFIKIETDSITTLDKLEDKSFKDKLNNLENEKAQILKKHPDMNSHFTILETVMPFYKDILSGKKKATDVMFPKFSMTLVENIYKNNIMADYFNNILQNAVLGHVKKHIASTGGHRTIRILEIGAGTGGSSEIILQNLSPYADHVKYYFTDLSMGFVRLAKKKYRSLYPFTVFKMFNIEEDREQPEFFSNSFDIIIASNVIHATKKIQPPLKNIYRLLKPEGIFLLNEITENQDFTTLTFGLLGGWWLFEDKDIRLPHAPLLSNEGWKSQIQKAGFDTANIVSTSYIDLKDSMSQSVIVAKKNTMSNNENLIKYILYLINNEMISFNEARAILKTN